MSDVYTSAYFGRYFKALVQWEPQAARVFLDQCNVTSLVDFGCGGAFFVAAAQAHGLWTLGYEQNRAAVLPYIPKETQSLVIEADVTQPIQAGTFDCAMSMEVAEHIPTEGSEALVANLVGAAERLILFTAAPPGQGGSGHINCQPKAFWTELFAARGWAVDDESTRALAAAWADVETRGYKADHIIRNLMLLRPL